MPRQMRIAVTSGFAICSGWLYSLTGFASQTVPDSSDPAGALLLILGLAAVILGMRNLRELRNKRIVPPRPPQHTGRSGRD